MSEPLPLDSQTHFGFITALPSPDETRRTVALAQRLEFDSIWVGDHVAFPVPIFDPLLQLAQAAAHGGDLLLGTAVYLLPLRHPTLVAKQVATLDHLTCGQLIFGVGVGGEFPNEYAACQVPVAERGRRLSESIPLLKRLWSGEPVIGDGQFYHFPEVRLRPAALQPGGPPIWCGGRSAAALARIGRMADGWISYVVTPAAYRRGLEAIAKAAAERGRTVERFGTGHLLFLRIDRDYDSALDTAAAHLSRRYGMDFREPARKYAALGPPEQVAETLMALHGAGVRHFVLDLAGPLEDRDVQLERFASQVRPLLAPG